MSDQEYTDGKQRILDMAKRVAGGVSKVHSIDITDLEWEGHPSDDHLRMNVGKNRRRYLLTEEAIEDYPGDPDRRHEVEQGFRVWLEIEAKGPQPPSP